MSQTETNPDDETESTDSGTTTLFDDDLYEHDKKGDTPEDIERDFEIPDNASLETLDLSPATIEELTTQPWEEARELTEGSDPSFNAPTKTTDLCSIDIEYEMLDIFISHIGGVVNEFKLLFTDDGWFTTFVDPANVAMMEVWIDKGDFADYSNSRETMVGIPVSAIEKVFKHSQPGDTISITINSDRKLVIEDGFRTETGLIDPDSVRDTPTLPLDTIDFTTQFTLPGVDLKHVSKSINEVSDHINIESKAEDQVVFSGETDSEQDDNYEKAYKTYKNLTEYRDRSITQYNFNIDVNESAMSKYSLDYMLDLFNHRKTMMRTDYHVQTGEEIPITARREVGEQSHIISLLAPRIKSN